LATGAAIKNSVGVAAEAGAIAATGAAVKNSVEAAAEARNILQQEELLRIL
jgi:hypothetical protein